MSKSKYLLIAGPARMGKSIIRQKLLEKYQVAGFCTDSLVAMLAFARPELGINFRNSDYSPVSKYVQGLLTYGNNYPLVFEGVGIAITDWPIYQKFHIPMIGLGTPKITVAQKMLDIRQNPSFNEWTDKFLDPELKILCQNLIQESQEIETQCQNFGLPFFDLSIDFAKSVDQVVDFIYSVLKN